MTILRQIYNYAQGLSPAQPLLTIPSLADLADISTEYSANHAEIDRYFVRKFYNFAFLDMGYNPASDNAALSGLQTLSKDELTVNYYRWSKLFDTISLDYNPLFNVDGKTVEEHDLYTDKDQYGSHTDTDTDAAYPFDDSTNEKNRSKLSMVRAQRNDEHEHGKQKITTTRTGNIGVTMSQEMLKAERAVVNWSFWDEFFRELIMKSFVVGMEV